MGRIDLCLSFILFWMNIFVANGYRTDVCECIKIDDCPSFVLLNEYEQKVWLGLMKPCDERKKKKEEHKETTHFGISFTTGEDYVCCPYSNYFWGNYKTNSVKGQSQSKTGQVTYNKEKDELKKLLQHLYGHSQNDDNFANIYSNVKKNSLRPREKARNKDQFRNLWKNPKAKRDDSIYHNGRNIFNRPNYSEQCAAQTSSLPNPHSGCCGRHTSDTDRISDLDDLLKNKDAPFKHHFWPSRSITWQRPHQSDRKADTEIDQFPWIAHLKMTFDHNNKLTTTNCAGSLISLQYVLTSCHCVFKQGANLINVEITLSEYDTKTSAVDCIFEPGEWPKCINNVHMKAEEVILHPEYDHDLLINDIALIRLKEPAPYTQFIRPICIPPVDIDNSVLSNLALTIVGWEDGGPDASEIKLSSVVHLVPFEECQKSSPYLTKSHICAISNADVGTCKSIPGASVMMLFKGSYYVVGILGGKKTDAADKKSIPTLYTNVFQHILWIKNNIKA